MITSTSAPASNLKASYNPGYVWLIAAVAAMGGLLFGWDWVVIGGAKPFFQRFFHLTSETQIGWANSCALVGCLIGAVFAAALSDKFGRKRLLIAAALIFAVTSLGNALANDFNIFIAWRIFGGVAIGLASNLSPMYIAEIAPAQIRGRLVSLNQLTIVIGILAAQFVNWWLVRNLPANATDEFIATSWFGQQGWRWMFGLTAAPALLFFIGMFLVPESPRWLAKNGQSAGASSVLEKIGGKPYAAAAMSEIQGALQEQSRQGSLADLFQPRLRRVLVLGIVLAVFQQWCGINVIFNYAEEIFHQAGYDISNVLKNIVWIGSVNMAFTLLALRIVDGKGRRPLMLFGAGSLAVIYTLMGICYYHAVQGWPVLVLVLAAISCYAMSLAPVTWVIISEIFPNRIRGLAMSVAVAALWIACFILTDTFPLLNKQLGAANTFWLYAAICALGFVFIFVKLPETKGKTLEQIERDLVD